MIVLCTLEIGVVQMWKLNVAIAPPRSPPPQKKKRTGKIGWIVNNSAVHNPIVLKSDKLVHYGSPVAAELWKSTSG